MKVCVVCDQEYAPVVRGWQRHASRFCSCRCAAEDKRRRAVARYPPKSEIERLYVSERLTDREIGRRFGHSYTWAMNVRRHYGIPGRGRGERSRINPDKHRRPGGDQWGLRHKGEEACRNCGQRAAHLHHIVPRSKSTVGRIDVENNGLPLCATCHMGWHHMKVVIPREVLRANEIAFAELHGGVVWAEKRYPGTRVVA